MTKILVNAMPLTVVGTGVGRYLRGLYSAMEAICPDDVEISYFIGDRVTDSLPPLSPPSWKERMGQLLWKLPHPLALGARLARHQINETRFRRLSDGYDVYHEAGYFPMPCADDRTRTVYTVHDLSLELHPKWHPRERVAYWRMFSRERIRLADAFYAVSEFTKKEMVNHLSLDPEAIAVTPLGVDESLFNPIDDGEAQSALEAMGLPKRYLLFVGSGDPRKRLEHAIAALRVAECGIPLVVVGWSGWTAPESSNVFNIGYVPDKILSQLYRRADLLLMPSEYEGFGLPLLEAMACGCPVLASRADALEEVGGEAAAHVEDTADQRQFAEAITKLAINSNEVDTMRSLGIKRAAQFTWRKTAEITLSRLLKV